MSQKVIDKEILNTFPADSKSQDLNGLHWEVTDWSIGDPITEAKMDNTEQGLIIAFYKLNAILKELGGVLPEASEDIQLNSSKLDAILDELGGTLVSETNKIEGSRLDSVIEKASMLAIELYGADNTSVASRIDKNENRIAAIISELGGTGSDGTSTTYSGTTKLDDLEKEIGGTRSEGNGYTNSRLDNIEEHSDTVDKAIMAIKAEVGGTYVENSGFTNSRIDTNEANISSLQTKTSALATELFNSDTVEGTSRLDKNDNKIKAIAAELGGIEPDGATTSYGGTTRLDDLETEIGGVRDEGNGYTGSRIDTNEANISALQTKASALATNLYGSDTTIGNSRLDSLNEEMYGASTSRSRLDDLELAVGGSRNLNTGGYDNNKIVQLGNRTSTLENIVGAPESITTITHESRLNKLESDIETITTLAAPPIVCVTSTNEDASDEITIETNILNNGIGFIFLNKATLGEQFITVRFDGYAHSVYLNGATRLKAKLNQSYLLGVYRNGENLYIFNAPAVL